MSDQIKPKLTIFTPTWNRADLLPRLFQSIRSQVDADGIVEWLVIDDGSTDDTQAVLAAFAKERPDLVRNLRVENGGKHRAINRASHESRGDWIMVVDSDDALVGGAITNVLKLIAQFDGVKEIGLIRGLCSFPEIERSDHSFQTARNPCRHWEWVSSQKPFDSAQVFRRSALAMHPFPEFDGEHFMAEAWLYHSMDSTHKVLFINNVWVNCWYQTNGLSRNALQVRLQSPRSTMLVYSVILNSPSDCKTVSRASANWWRYWFHANEPALKSVKRPRWLFALFGWILYRRDLIRLRQS